MIVFFGWIIAISVVGSIRLCQLHLENYPKCSHSGKEEHVDGDQVFIDEEVGHSFDVEARHHDGADHHDVEEKEHREKQEVCDFLE